MHFERKKKTGKNCTEGNLGQNGVTLARISLCFFSNHNDISSDCLTIPKNSMIFQEFQRRFEITRSVLDTAAVGAAGLSG